MRWYAVLRKSGGVVVSRLWKAGDDCRAAKLSSSQEVFGPFEAANFPAAKLKARTIMAAVGFVVRPDVVQDR